MIPSVTVRRSLLMILCAVVVGAMLWITYMLMLQTPASDLSSESEVQQVKITGTVIVTGIETGAEEGGVYELNLSSGSLKKLYDGYYFAPSVSKDGKLAVVTKLENNTFGLVAAQNLEGADATIVTPPIDGLYAGTSAWSYDGRYLVYAARPANALDDTLSISESKIFILDTVTGDQIEVGSGVSPLFMPDDSIVFVGEFGVYRVRRTGMSLQEPEGFLGLKNEKRSATFGTMLAISSDGTRIALADPDGTELRLYQVDGDGMVRDERIIPAVASMPVFSPDGSMVTYVGLSVNDEKTKKKNVLVVNTTTLEGVYNADLSVFDDYMFSFGIWK